jgi:hypothetical protein
MKTYYPMATYDGQTDNFHTLTTYDSQFTVNECLIAIRNWISAGFKIDKCWIQEYDTDTNVPRNISVHIVGREPKVIYSR